MNRKVEDEARLLSNSKKDPIIVTDEYCDRTNQSERIEDEARLLSNSGRVEKRNEAIGAVVLADSNGWLGSNQSTNE